MTEREEFDEWRLHYWRNVCGFGGKLTVEEHREQLRTSLSRNEVFAAWQAARRADEALMRDVVEAMEHHAEQTRPITLTETAIAALRARLEGTTS